MRMVRKLIGIPSVKNATIGTVVGIEATQKILIGLACATRVLDCNEPRNQAQHLRRTSLRLEQIFFVGMNCWEEAATGRAPMMDTSGHINDFGVRIVGEGQRRQGAETR